MLYRNRRQVHFLVMERNNVPVPPAQLEYIDSVITPFWPGSGPFNSVKVVSPSPSWPAAPYLVARSFLATFRGFAAEVFLVTSYG